MNKFFGLFRKASAPQPFKPASLTAKEILPKQTSAASGHTEQNRKTLGILIVRFSIDRLNELSGSYGYQSGRLIGQVVPAELLEGMLISDGDSAATLAGHEYVCMVSVSSDDISLLKQKVEPLLKSSDAIRQNGADPITQVVTDTRERLAADGIVRNGRIEGPGGWCAKGFMSAWEETAEKAEMVGLLQTMLSHRIGELHNESQNNKIEIKENVQ